MEPLYREALAGRRETLGDKDAGTLESVNNLAELFEATGACGALLACTGGIVMCVLI